MTLVECIVALVVASVMVAAVDAALLAGRRFARSATAARGVRQNLRAAAAVLRHELETVSPAAGDLLAFSDSTLRIRAQRAFGVVCAIPSAGTIVLDDSLLPQQRAVDPSRDRALVLREGDVLTSADDRWISAPVTQVRRGVCTGGAPGTALALNANSADFGGIGLGAAVRVFEIAEYRRYRDAGGDWWIGVRTPSGAGWSSTSPVAGPLAPSGGFVVRAYTTFMTRTTAPDSVAVIEADIRVVDERHFSPPGRPPGTLVDSITLRVGLAGP